MEGKNKPKTRRKGKRRMIGWIIALIVVVVLFGIGAMFCAPWSPLQKEHEEAKNVPIKAVEFSKLKDGIYTGGYAGGMYKWRANQVRVSVASGKVTDIEPLGTQDPNKKNVERDTIYDRVMEAQSLQVDAVSGATLTSKAYLKGLENALMQAEK